MAFGKFKKVEISNEDLLGLSQQLNVLHQGFGQGGYKLPTKASYALSRNVKFIQGQIKDFSDSRDEIIKEYVEMDGERPKVEDYVSNQDEIDAANLANEGIEDGAELTKVPAPKNSKRLVFKDLENGEKEANDKIELLTKEVSEVQLYAFPDSLEDWDNEEIPHGLLAALWDTVDVIAELLGEEDSE